jgi:ribonuclease VapC
VSRAVLDASALIAYLREEPGADIVGTSLRGSAISTVNLAEVATRFFELGMLEAELRATIRRLSIEVAPLDEGLAYEAAKLRQPTRRFGLSLGDRACLALASRLECPVLTADQHWAGVDVGIDIRLIRPAR